MFKCDTTGPKCRKWTSQTSEFQALNNVALTAVYYFTGIKHDPVFLFFTFLSFFKQT